MKKYQIKKKLKLIILLILNNYFINFKKLINIFSFNIMFLIFL